MSVGLNRQAPHAPRWRRPPSLRMLKPRESPGLGEELGLDPAVPAECYLVPWGSRAGRVPRGSVDLYDKLSYDRMLCSIKM